MNKYWQRVSKTLSIHRLTQLHLAPLWYRLTVWAILAVIILNFLSLISFPFRSAWSENYVLQGDHYLNERKYSWAKINYQKAILINKSNKEAKKQFELSRSGSLDIAMLSDFFKLKNNNKEMNLYSRANFVFTKPFDAISVTKSLLEENEPQYAIIAAKKSLELDENFVDGWLYLGIANLKAKDLINIDQKSGAYFKNEAKKCFEKVLSLDPQNSSAKEYLK